MGQMGQQIAVGWVPDLRSIGRGFESQPARCRVQPWASCQHTCASVTKQYKDKVKVKVHILDLAPLRSESPPQKRSGMARVLKGFHSFTYTPTRSSASGMSHTCLCLPSYGSYSFTDLGGMEGWVDLGAKALAEIRTCNLPIAKPTFCQTATSPPLIWILTISTNIV